MAYFAVSYELKYQSELARRRFCDEAERLGGIEVVDRLYIVELDGVAEEVLDHLRKFIADGDRLVVIEFGNPPAVIDALAGAENWVAERFRAIASAK